MDGVLESTIALCGCKVLCSVLCLPVFKDSISSVSMCCICLLLFTDLSITSFLVYLWSSSPTPASFHPSSDVVALRFMLFLSDTYEAVVMLTPLLVVVELLVRLLWGGEKVTSITEKRDADGDAWENEDDKKANAASLKALGFLGCLMLWFMCGTYAGFSWRQEQERVRSCMERGSLLFTCLPCLLNAASPFSRQLFWALPAVVLLLGLAAILNFIIEKLRPYTFNPEPLTGQTLEKTSIPELVCDVDSNSCATLSSGNDEQRWVPSCLRAELPESRESVTLVLRVHRAAPHPRESRLWQAVTRESPRLRGELITGLLCGLLVCMFPTVLSTNVLLMSNLDALAVYVVKHLLTPSSLHFKAEVKRDACFHSTPRSEHS
ncbi:hypothetical protein C0J50_17449 [Silurus asotus]|uniref:Uncharacterized protein n=1 Tax=Silurus asotus TaxID=30991 RepID=A0AAD5AWP5_SILAS|nr:hypothetical protein C0J50_17449 [Silurus asotus]